MLSFDEMSEMIKNRCAVASYCGRRTFVFQPDVAVNFCLATACNATHGIAKAILSVRLSVCLSIGRVDCDKTKKLFAHIVIPHERSFII